MKNLGGGIAEHHTLEAVSKSQPLKQNGERALTPATRCQIRHAITVPSGSGLPRWIDLTFLSVVVVVVTSIIKFTYGMNADTVLMNAARGAKSEAGWETSLHWSVYRHYDNISRRDHLPRCAHCLDIWRSSFSARWNSISQFDTLRVLQTNKSCSKLGWPTCSGPIILFALSKIDQNIGKFFFNEGLWRCSHLIPPISHWARLVWPILI